MAEQKDNKPAEGGKVNPEANVAVAERITSISTLPDIESDDYKPKSVSDYQKLIKHKQTLAVEGLDPRFHYRWINMKEDGRYDQMTEYGYRKVRKGEGSIKSRYAKDRGDEYVTVGDDMLLVKCRKEDWDNRESARRKNSRAKLMAKSVPEGVAKKDRPDGIGDLEVFEDTLEVGKFDLKSGMKGKPTNG